MTVLQRSLKSTRLSIATTDLELAAMSGCERDQAGMALLYTVPDGRPVWGLASLGDELFVVREGATRVEVYRYATLHRRLDVPGLAAARDLAACQLNACLYVTDVGNSSNEDPRHRYVIHRLTVDGKTTSRWPVSDKPWGVSVTVDHSVLVTFVQRSLVVEYSTDGQPLRHIRLPPDVLHPLHAGWLPSGHLVVGHGDGADALHRLCAFDVDDGGRATVAVALDGLRPAAVAGDDRESVLDVTELECLVGGRISDVAMDVPGHVAVDELTGLVLVADVNNSRLLVVDRRLRRCSVLLELAAEREFPTRLCLDEQRCRLYVAYNGAVRDGRWTAGRVLVFFFGDHRRLLIQDFRKGRAD